MNRSILLVIMDFLVLSLLSIANFDNPVQDEGSPPPETAQAAAAAAPPENDLMDFLSESLEAEQQEQQALEAELAAAREAIDDREQALQQREAELDAARRAAEQNAKAREELAAETERLESERQRLADAQARLRQQREQAEEEREATLEELARAERERANLASTVAKAEAERARAEERQKALQERLLAQDETLAQARQQLSSLEQEKEELSREKAQIGTRLQVAERERELVAEQLTNAELAIQNERQERMAVVEDNRRLQRQTEQLSEGVTELAESSERVREEIEKAQPLSLNTIFQNFQENRLKVTFEAELNAVFGSRTETLEAQSVLVTDGQRSFALVFADDTPFEVGGNTSDILRATGTIEAAGKRVEVRRLGFLAADPRIIAIPVDPTLLGLEPYPIALDPFRFPEAVLVDNQSEYYGQSTFQIDTGQQRYLVMQREILSRLFGKFSPHPGDLVFSQTGGFLGLMVNDEYALRIEDFGVGASFDIGANFSRSLANETLDRLRDWVDNAPADYR